VHDRFKYTELQFREARKNNAAATTLPEFPAVKHTRIAGLEREVQKLSQAYEEAQEENDRLGRKIGHY